MLAYIAYYVIHGISCKPLHSIIAASCPVMSDAPPPSYELAIIGQFKDNDRPQPQPSSEPWLGSIQYPASGAAFPGIANFIVLL